MLRMFCHIVFLLLGDPLKVCSDLFELSLFNSRTLCLCTQSCNLLFKLCPEHYQLFSIQGKPYVPLVSCFTRANSRFFCRSDLFYCRNRSQTAKKVMSKNALFSALSSSKPCLRINKIKPPHKPYNNSRNASAGLALLPFAMRNEYVSEYIMHRADSRSKRESSQRANPAIVRRALPMAIGIGIILRNEPGILKSASSSDSKNLL